MFDFAMKISEQRCSPAGSRLNVTLEIDGNKAIRKAPTSGAPSDWKELEVMLAGGHRNLVTQPVSTLLGLVEISLSGGWGICESSHTFLRFQISCQSNHIAIWLYTAFCMFCCLGRRGSSFHQRDGSAVCLIQTGFLVISSIQI